MTRNHQSRTNDSVSFESSPTSMAVLCMEASGPARSDDDCPAGLNTLNRGQPGTVPVAQRETENFFLVAHHPESYCHKQPCRLGLRTTIVES